MKIKLFPPQAIHEMGQRDNQEDAIYPLKGKAKADDKLFLVCDGMGGHAKGEVASRTVAATIATFLKKNLDTSKDILTNELLMQAIEEAYKALDVRDDGSFKKMGTTLTLVSFHKGGATVAHIGDSRIYHLRPSTGEILYKSRDHSLVYELYQAGELSYREMKTSPQKNVITRAMMPGEDSRTRADIVHIADIKPGDYFYHCSDGMLEEMDDEDLMKIFCSDDSDQLKASKLVAATTGSKDNHSAYLIKVASVEPEPGDDAFPNDEATALCNAVNIERKLGKDDLDLIDVDLDAEDDETTAPIPPAFDEKDDAGTPPVVPPEIAAAAATAAAEAKAAGGLTPPPAPVTPPPAPVADKAAVPAGPDDAAEITKQIPPAPGEASKPAPPAPGEAAKPVPPAPGEAAKPVPPAPGEAMKPVGMGAPAGFDPSKMPPAPERPKRGKGGKIAFIILALLILGLLGLGGWWWYTGELPFGLQKYFGEAKTENTQSQSSESKSSVSVSDESEESIDQNDIQPDDLDYEDDDSEDGVYRPDNVDRNSDRREREQGRSTTSPTQSVNQSVRNATQGGAGQNTGSRGRRDHNPASPNAIQNQNDGAANNAESARQRIQQMQRREVITVPGGNSDNNNNGNNNGKNNSNANIRKR